jgi:O-antigen/teichoic acid export membrane protein
MPVADQLTAGRLLARNSGLNLLAYGLPLIAAVALIPPLIAGLGEERFGILAIAWMLLGYFSMLDLGISRAVTHAVAERTGAGREEEAARAVRTASVMLLGLGAALAAALALAAPWLARLFSMPAALEAETTAGLVVVAAAIPAVLGAAVSRAVLEARQRFGVVSAIRVPLGVLTFAAPVLVLPVSAELPVVLGSLAMVRYLAWGAFALGARGTLPGTGGRRFDRGEAARLLRFGGWVTVSNVVSPLMVSADRVVIAAALSSAAVTYYVTPFEVVTKLWIVPAAVLGVLFPAFAASATADPARAALLLRRTGAVVAALLLPVAVLLTAFAQEGLTLWLGGEFAERSTTVARWLVAGVFVNCLAHAPFAFLQAAGRPDLPAKLHLVELPLYAGLLIVLVPPLGIEGVAIAWFARSCIDTALHLALSARLRPGARGAMAEVGAVAAVGLAALGLAASLQPQIARGGLVLAMAALAGIYLFMTFGSPAANRRMRPMRDDRGKNANIP